MSEYSRLERCSFGFTPHHGAKSTFQTAFTETARCELSVPLQRCDVTAGRRGQGEVPMTAAYQDETRARRELTQHLQHELESPARGADHDRPAG